MTIIQQFWPHIIFGIFIGIGGGIFWPWLFWWNR
jgi:hypothetical protein